MTHDAGNAAARAAQAGKDADQCGFAGAVGAKQAEEFAGLDAQADAGQRLKITITLGDINDFDGMCHRRMQSGRSAQRRPLIGGHQFRDAV